MSEKYSVFARNPTVHQDAGTVVEYAISQYFLNHFENMLPAIVEAYDRGSNTATVRPIVKVTMADDSTHSRGRCYQVQCVSLGAGGFHISFPIVKGDLGWIEASDRDLALFRQSLTEQAAGSSILHSFGSSRFFPDVFRKYTIAGEDSGAMVIQSTSSATRISIRGDNIKITTPVDVTIDTPLVHMTGSLLVDGSTTITGATAMNGGMTQAAGQTCTLNSPITSTAGAEFASAKVGGIAVGGHTHTDPQGGDTGPMK